MSRPDQSITFLRSLRVQCLSFSASIGATARADAPRREGPDAARHGAGPRRRRRDRRTGRASRCQSGDRYRGEGNQQGQRRDRIEHPRLVHLGARRRQAGSRRRLQQGTHRDLPIHRRSWRTWSMCSRVEKFVKAGRISPHIPSGTLEKLLDDEVYVVTSVLKTKKIVVRRRARTARASRSTCRSFSRRRRQRQRRYGERASNRKSRSRARYRWRSRSRPCSSCSTTPAQFLTTQQLAAGDAAARALPSGLTGRAVRSSSKPAAHSCAWRSKETRVTEKRLTVILYGCDRNLWRGGPLKYPRLRRVRVRRSARALHRADGRRIDARASAVAAV